MKIESIIRRKNGTVVELDDEVYHFKPTGDDPRHLADVNVRAHVQRFLSIPEGYQPAELSEAAVVDPVPPSDLNTPQPVIGSLAGVQEQDGSVTELEDLPREQLLELARGMEIDGVDDLTDEQLVAAIKAEPLEIVEEDEEVDESETEEATETTADRDALAKQYEEKFGKKPHHKLSAERIQQILNEDE